MRTIDLGGEWDIDSLDGEYSLKGRIPGTLFEHLEAISTLAAGLRLRSLFDSYSGA
jgi:hypothetical protein